MATHQDSTSVPDGFKRCVRCGETKPRSAFFKWRGAKCKDCRADLQREYLATSMGRENRHSYNTSPEVRANAKKHAAAFYLRNPGYARRRHLRRFYNMTLEEWGVMFGKQEGLCAICARWMEGAKNSHVDHCHETGKVRALLCNDCNIALGGFKDSHDLLRAAADYLALHSIT